MTDEELEGRLLMYWWLAMNTPTRTTKGCARLAYEVERRGQVAMVEGAKLRARTAMAGDTGIKPQ
jgi:hypothetical protein